MGLNVPIYITTRDRVTDLKALVDWLERAGHERITFIDNHSTYEPLLDYLDLSPHELIRLDDNRGARALWHEGLVPDEPFVVTDPDLVPIDDCPLDLVDHLANLLDRHPQHAKAGIGLHLDDVPNDLACLPWERELVAQHRQLDIGVFDSLIDTTFALHRAGCPFMYEAIRTGFPYQARHMPWYRRTLDTEHAFYLDHAERGPEGTTWEATHERGDRR